MARKIVRRHVALSDFLVSVFGVDPEEANQATCKMEHSVSKSIVDRLVKYAEYIKHCSRGCITWDSVFGYYCKTGCVSPQCERLQPNRPGDSKGQDPVPSCGIAVSARSLPGKAAGKLLLTFSGKVFTIQTMCS